MAKAIMQEIDVVSPEKLNISIELHRNGVTMSAYVPRKRNQENPGPSEELSYVYKTVKEAAAELEGFVSVLKEKAGLNSQNPTANEADLGNSKKEK